MKSDQSYSLLCKIILVGDSSTGKTCLLSQLVDGKFMQMYDMTIGVQFGSKILHVKENNVKLQIWDTSGQESFKSITRSYYRGSAAVILVYDITNRKSFTNLTQWVKQIAQYNDKAIVILVGNKTDSNQKREVSTEEGSVFASQHKLLFMECSAKDNGLTQQVFIKVTSQILKRIQENIINPQDPSFGVKFAN